LAQKQKNTITILNANEVVMFCLNETAKEANVKLISA
jgi:hypothetical protein